MTCFRSWSNFSGCFCLEHSKSLAWDEDTGTCICKAEHGKGGADVYRMSVLLTCNTVRLRIQIKNCNVLLESVERNRCSYTDSLPLKYVCVLMCGCRPVEMNANHYEFKNFTLTKGLEKWVSSELEFLCTSAQPGKLGCGLSSGWVCCSVYSCSWTRISVLQSRVRVRETKSSEQDFQWNPPLPGEQGWGLGSGGGCRSTYLELDEHCALLWDKVEDFQRWNCIGVLPSPETWWCIVEFKGWDCWKSCHRKNVPVCGCPAVREWANSSCF